MLVMAGAKLRPKFIQENNLGLSLWGAGTQLIEESHASAFADISN